MPRKGSYDTAMLMRDRSGSSISHPRSPLERSHTPSAGSPLSGSSADETEKEKERAKEGDTPATTPEPGDDDSILMEPKLVNGKRVVRKDTVEPILQAHSAMSTWK